MADKLVGPLAVTYMTASKVSKLTKREREITALVAEGFRNKEIAERLFISSATVRHHLSAIFAKSEVTDRLKLMVFAFRNGLAEPSEKSKK